MKGKSSLFSTVSNHGNKIGSVEYGYLFKNHVNPHNLPMTGEKPNSVRIQKDDSGRIIRERYYDDNGNAYKDIDYTDHGHPEIHKVPHTHIIIISDIIDRKKGAKSYENRTI